MKNTIIYLIGFAGTGKLTTAMEICKLAEFKLIDNHYINNPIFKLIHKDSKTPLPKAIWAQTRKIRETILETIETLSPPEYNFIFTNQLENEDPNDIIIYKQIENVALIRKSTFVPVRLTCEIEENMRRVSTPQRALNMKHTSVEIARHNRSENTILNIDHTNLLDLDITNSPAEITAQIILDHARNCVRA